MADLVLINRVRRAIDDSPKFEFNEVLADGLNASWRLTNAPVEEASESVFVSGVIMQSMTPAGTLKTDATTEDYTLDLGSDASLYSVNDMIALDNEIDQQKYLVASKTSSILTLNRKLATNYASGRQCYKITRNGYTIDYNYGIIYFTVTHPVGTTLAAKFRHYSYLNNEIENLYSDALSHVQRDTDASVTADVVILKLRHMILQSALSGGADGAIKIKQGSTSLDLTGSSYMISKQVEQAEAEYKAAVRAYLWDKLEGGAAVGREGYVV